MEDDLLARPAKANELTGAPIASVGASDRCDPSLRFVAEQDTVARLEMV